MFNLVKSEKKDNRNLRNKTLPENEAAVNTCNTESVPYYDTAIKNAPGTHNDVFRKDEEDLLQTECF